MKVPRKNGGSRSALQATVSAVRIASVTTSLALVTDDDRARLAAMSRPVFIVTSRDELAPGNRAAIRWLAKRPSQPNETTGLERAVVEWGLSRRQAEVLRLVANGHANLTIAARLGISPRTVETHVSAILVRAGAASRPELVVLMASK